MAGVRRGALTDHLGPRTLLIGGVLIASWAAFAGSIADPDFWWHLRTGRWIVEHLSLPQHDLYTYTVPDHVWTDHEYLTEALMWLVYSAGGMVAVSLAFGAITWAALLIIHRTARPGRRPYVVVALVLLLGVLAGAPIWGPRAQMITFLLSAVELMWLRSYLEGRSRALNWFPLVMVLWANLHGGWVIGFGFLGIAIASEAIHWLLERGDPSHVAHLRRLLIISAASAAAVMATPHGPALYLYPFQTQGSVAQQRLIVEWFSPDFHVTALLPFEAMILLVVVAFALRRPRLYDVLLTCATLGLALHSVRHVALFVAAVTPILVVHVSEIWVEQSGARGWRLPATVVTAPLAAITVVALVVIAGVMSIRIGGDLARQDRVTSETFPVATADWMAAHPEMLGTRMYNQYGWGGYLIQRFYPDPSRRVFIFGEAALMGDDMLNRYEDVQTLRPDWAQVLDRNRVDYIVYNRGEALANVLSTQPGWRLVHEDSLAVVYVRVR